MVANREFDSVMFKPGIIDFAAPSTSTWNVSTAVYASLSKSVSSQSTYPYGVTFSSDGTKMYIVDVDNLVVYQYTLSTAWNVSTAVYASLSKSVSGQSSSPVGVAFSSDGTKMYIVDYSNLVVYQYTLSTAWNVSTAVYASLSKSVSSQSSHPRGVTFSSDGTKMYIVDNVNLVVYQYTLSTAWNVSTAVYASLSISTSGQSSSPVGVAFSSDGTKMYIVNESNQNVYQYTLSTAWNVSTAVYASLSVSVSGQSSSPVGVAFSSDGTKMYIVDYSNKAVYQYTMH
jgi:DNA-binding beta-propeller fold protein YncE